MYVREITMYFLIILVLVLVVLYKMTTKFFNNPVSNSSSTDLLNEYWRSSNNLKLRLGMPLETHHPENHVEISLENNAAAVLKLGRNRLARNYGKRACNNSGFIHGHQTQFRRDWKELCNLVEAKYGSSTTNNALRSLNFDRWS